jgi:signal transduction histidine kinase
VAVAEPRAVTLLVVEDDPSVRALVRESVPGDWRVLEAGTRAEALSLAAEREPDLVVLGLPMSDADGLEVFRELERRAERGPFLPVLLLSAPGDRDPREGALAAGADDILPKPPDPRELRLRLRVLERLREHELLLRAQEDELSALVAHDLRNPLSAAAGILGMLRKEATDPVLREDLETAHSGVARAREILDDVLRARMLEVGSIPVARSPSDLAELANAAVRSLEAAAREQGVELVGPPGPGPVLPIDPDLVRRAIENLAANSVRYSRRGGRVEIAVREREGAAVIEVSDRGATVPDALKATIFEKFGSVVAARGSARRGHGLALHLVWLVARRHGGQVDVLDREGGGTTFRLVLAPPRERRGQPRSP